MIDWEAKYKELEGDYNILKLKYKALQMQHDKVDVDMTGIVTSYTTGTPEEEHQCYCGYDPTKAYK
jgi:hypothetical protein